VAEKSTVQCNADDKTFLLDTAERLDWSLPKLMTLAVRGLRVMVEGEESSEERAERMVAKLSNSATPVRRVSHMSTTSGSNRSESEAAS